MVLNIKYWVWIVFIMFNELVVLYVIIKLDRFELVLLIMRLNSIGCVFNNDFCDKLFLLYFSNE